MKYYNNGFHEKKFEINDEIPDGWKLGRLRSTITTKDTIKINNGLIERHISKNSMIPDGWVKGRIKEKLNPIKQSETQKNKKAHWYNNGEVEILIPEGDQQPENFIKGRLEFRQESRLKMSSSHKGLRHTEDAKRKISQNSNNNRKKASDTILRKYGSFENYYQHIRSETEKTQRRNKTFNTSKKENEFYKALCEQYGKENILREYKSKEYPYRCDFYIKSLNKYIELNFHWTHGFQPYEKDNLDCQKQLLEWQEKAKTSQFYRNAIQTWTIRDVEKLKCAQLNNLNYEVIY